MSNMRVGVQAPGAKSLPAQFRVGAGGVNGLGRLQAGHGGFRGMGRLGLTQKIRMRGMRGLGDDDGDGLVTPDLTDLPITTTPVIDLTPDLSLTAPAGAYSAPIDITDQTALMAYTPPLTAYTGPTTLAPNATTPTAPSGYQWANLVNSTGQTLAKVLAISQGGSTVTLPNGTQIVYGSAASAAAGSVSSLLGGTVGGIPMSTILVLGAGLVLVMMVTGGGGGRR